MPDGDGLSLLREYRSIPSLQHVPIVMLSSEEDAKVKAEAFVSGANDYLIKFPDKVELSARIRHHSAAFINKLQRDEAFLELQESQLLLEAANAELLRVSTTDELTNVANRRHFNDFIDREWRHAGRTGMPISLVMVDIDFFKHYNDEFGHQAGDECLKMVARLLNDVLSRTTDLFARYGGEEFVGVLPITPVDRAVELAEKMRLAVEKANIKGSSANTAGCVTVSLGVASMKPSRGKTCDDLLKAADQALYQAKESGRNRVRIMTSGE